MDRKLDVIEMEVKPKVYHDEEYKNKPIIMKYCWKLVQSQASRQDVVQQLNCTGPNSINLKEVLQSSECFLHKEDALQDAMCQQTKLDCTHLILLHCKADAPRLLQILEYHACMELARISYNLWDIDNHKKTFDSAWEVLYKNIDNFVSWINAVLSKIPMLGVSEEGKKLYLIDAYGPLDMNVMKHGLRKIQNQKRCKDFKCPTIPPMLKSLMKNERNHLVQSGKCPLLPPNPHVELT